MLFHDPVWHEIPVHYNTAGSAVAGGLWNAPSGQHRAVIMFAMVLATALGRGVSGTLIDRGINLPAQLLVLAVWCLAGSILLAVTCWRLLF